MKQHLKILIILFIILNSSFLIGQNADCDNLLILKDTIYHSKAISGFGDKKEFSGNELENDRTFEDEKNSIWYFIVAPSDGVFTFDIITENTNDDWDFLLYKYKKKFCKQIEDKVIVPIRTNLSRSPITGLSREGGSNFVGAGINANYSRPIRVKKGDRFVLVVNNPKRAGGIHILKLHFPPSKEAIETKPIKEEPIESTTTKFELVVKNKGTKDLLKGDLSITGVSAEAIIVNGKSVYVQFLSKKNRVVHISASAKGYMLFDKELKVGKNRVIFSYDIFLEPIKTGAKVNLKKIQFLGNRSDFLPGASSSLEALLSFMQKNPKVVIEIEGHVNGPKQKNSKEYKELSYSRSYAVKAFLIKNGIEKERIDFKGYGNSQMLYPNPKSEYQQSANRRVEIKILSNE
ncbi:MAG: OmpA family protein [Flavobacteriales bacterium]|nr:OmpA family protein [Flavobacteriales bacterium]